MQAGNVLRQDEAVAAYLQAALDGEAVQGEAHSLGVQLLIRIEILRQALHYAGIKPRAAPHVVVCHLPGHDHVHRLEAGVYGSRHAGRDDGVRMLALDNRGRAHGRINLTHSTDTERYAGHARQRLLRQRELLLQRNYYSYFLHNDTKIVKKTRVHSMEHTLDVAVS